VERHCPAGNGDGGVSPRAPEASGRDPLIIPSARVGSKQTRDGIVRETQGFGLQRDFLSRCRTDTPPLV